MPDRPDLEGLLGDPARALQVPAEAIAALLSEVSTQEAKLGTLKAILAVRLAAPPVSTNGRQEEADDLLLTDVAAVARIVRRSVSWVRKNGHTLPGFSQPGGKGCKVAWARRRLEAWAAAPPS